jgi:hypothetical protein
VIREDVIVSMQQRFHNGIGAPLAGHLLASFFYGIGKTFGNARQAEGLLRGWGGDHVFSFG